jgi:hypothetical protein
MEDAAKGIWFWFYLPQTISTMGQDGRISETMGQVIEDLRRYAWNRLEMAIP